MSIDLLHAYHVHPSDKDGPARASGGPVQLDDELSLVIGNAKARANFDRRLEVSFETSDDRANQMREWVMTFAFRTDVAIQVSQEIADHWSVTHDHRSKPGLMLIVRERDGDRAAISIWILPVDEALRFNANSRDSTISVLKEIFSTTSVLRKAAYFAGRNSRSDFLGGRVLDFQSPEGNRGVAQIWVKKFLLARPTVSPEAAHFEMIKGLKRLQGNADTPDKKQDLAQAITAIHASLNELSVSDIAENFLPDGMRDRFLGDISEATAQARFAVNREELLNSVGFYQLKLESGVVVLVPTPELDESVTVERGASPKVVCHGEVVDQKLRGRAR